MQSVALSFGVKASMIWPKQSLSLSVPILSKSVRCLSSWCPIGAAVVSSGDVEGYAMARMLGSYFLNCYLLRY